MLTLPRRHVYRRPHRSLVALLGALVALGAVEREARQEVKDYSQELGSCAVCGRATRRGAVLCERCGRELEVGRR